MSVKKSFFEEPVSLVLSPFANFNFEKTSSWSEIELYATISGLEIDRNFLNVLFAASYYFDGIYDAILSEIKSPESFIDSLVNSVEFIELLFKVWTPPDTLYGTLTKPTLDIQKAMWDIGICIPPFYRSNEDDIRRKYELLSALDSKFPYLLVKFYAKNSAGLRRKDMQFVTWLIKRLEARSLKDDRLDSIMRILKYDAESVDKTIMFMN